MKPHNAGTIVWKKYGLWGTMVSNDNSQLCCWPSNNTSSWGQYLFDAKLNLQLSMGLKWNWTNNEKNNEKNGWFLKWFQVVLEINGMKWNYQSHDSICFWSIVWFVLKLCRTNVHFLKLHLNFNAILKPEEWPESSWPRFMAQLAQAQVPSKSGNEVMIGSAIRVFLRLDSFYFYLY